ncbi:MAG: response regulator transcription factor [Nitrospira sp.]
MSQEKGVHIVIVDDHALMRTGIRLMLENYADIHIVGEAGDGFEAISVVSRLRPHVVLMDINMPRMNGIEATAEITSKYPDTIIIGLSVNANVSYRELMKQAGAVRLILKDDAPEQLYQAIHEAVTIQDTSR